MAWSVCLAKSLAKLETLAELWQRGLRHLFTDFPKDSQFSSHNPASKISGKQPLTIAHAILVNACLKLRRQDLHFLN